MIHLQLSRRIATRRGRLFSTNRMERSITILIGRTEIDVLKEWQTYAHHKEKTTHTIILSHLIDDILSRISVIDNQLINGSSSIESSQYFGTHLIPIFAKQKTKMRSIQRQVKVERTQIRMKRREEKSIANDQSS